MSWTALQTLDGVPYWRDTMGHLSLDAPEVMAQDKEAGTGWIWLEDADEGWLPARRRDEATALVDGKAVALAGRRTLPLLRSSLDRPIVDDLVMLEDLNEGLVCHTLRSRFMSDDFYTSVGTILIAINPFKYHSIYTPEHIQSYRNPGNRQLKPHIFQVAAAAHTALALEGSDQAILISGESGAGKTEATKHCLAYLAEVAGAYAESSIETQVLQANPILEAFGNAKTVRNNNSSRFGRWLEIHFDATGVIASARIEQYLLEKSRVIFQAAEERSFHIFYMLCESRHGAQLGLEAPSAYRLLTQPGTVVSIEGRDEVGAFDEMLGAMEGLGFGADEIEDISEHLGAVLIIGNLDFAASRGKDDGSSKDGGKDGGVGGSMFGAKHSAGSRGEERGCYITDADAVQRIAKLWKVTPTALMGAFTRRSIEVRGETSVIPLRPREAFEACAATAKSVYGALFSHLVRRINELTDGPRGRSVGLLDIFGFEIFQTNSFEQLCINYANEKLQQLFNLHTFTQEEALYKAEGIDHHHIEFIDNQPVLSLIEAVGGVGKPAGLLMCLDDEAFLGPQGSEEGFMRNVTSYHGKSELFHVFTQQERKRDGVPAGFSIHHYAGTVPYAVAGFLEKNQDPVSPDLAELLASSSSPIARGLFAQSGAALDDTTARGRAASAARERAVTLGMREARGPSVRSTLGGQFRSQLARLMEALRATNPHFVRCIKPNAVRAPRRFDAPMSLTQLRHAGVFEAVTIRRMGFPYRMPLERFCHWFRCLLLPRTASGYTASRSFSLVPWTSDDPRERARQILAHTGQDLANVQVGRTLCLYRGREQRLLTLLRSLALAILVPFMQRLVRGHLARECRRRAIGSRGALAAAVGSVRSVAECDAAASAHARVMGRFVKLFSLQIPELKQLRGLRAAFQQWIVLERELETALAKYAIADEGAEEEAAFAVVEAACLHADQLRGVVACTPFQQKIYDHARKIVDANAAGRLLPLAEEALWLLDKTKLSHVCDEAARVGFRSPEVDEVASLLSLPEEQLVAKQLKRAHELNDPQRVRNREVRLRNLYIQKYARLYVPLAYPRLRSPMEWAEAKTGLVTLIKGRAAVETLAASMLQHSSRPIHIALTDVQPALLKEALSMFKAMLAWGGERPDASPAAQACYLLRTAKEHEELRPELYLQLMKQLTLNAKPSASNYWDLLALALLTVPPGAGVEDFVHAFCQSHADESLRKRLIDQLHNGSYGEKVLEAAPQPEQLPNLLRSFMGFRRAQSRFSDDDLIRAATMSRSLKKYAPAEGATAPELA